MSTLWTPDGERRVPPPSDEGDAEAASVEDSGAAGSPPSQSSSISEPELTPEQEEQARAVARELSEARARILSAEASTVVANHAFGIYELAAIHLTADEPKLTEAQLAIDALAALVNGLEGRLGDGEATLTEALRQAQLLFVQQSEARSAPPSEP